MVTEEDLLKTNISMSYTLSPVKNLIGDMSGMLGNFCDEFLGAFYPRIVCQRANIVVTELVNNAIANKMDQDSKIILELSIDGSALCIKVTNVADQEQYDKVKAHIERINTTDNKIKLLAETIRQRRKERLGGGLGLIRLAAENKFNLSVDYDAPFLIVESKIALGGLR